MYKLLISFSEEICHCIVSKKAATLWNLAFVCIIGRLITTNTSASCCNAWSEPSTIEVLFCVLLYWVIHKLCGQVTNLVFINISHKAIRVKNFQWQDWVAVTLSVLKYLEPNQRQFRSKTGDGKLEAN